MSSVTTKYCIFIDTICEGPTPCIRDRDGQPFVFASRKEAEFEIADALIVRLQQFFDGERDFDDALTIEEYVVEVTVETNGSVAPQLAGVKSAGI